LQLFKGAYQTGGEGVSNWNGHKALHPQYIKHGEVIDQPTATLLSDDKVSINGNSGAIMEQEITYAAQTRLNYWTLLNQQIAVTTTLAGSDKKLVRCCDTGASFGSGSAGSPSHTARRCLRC